MLGEIYLKSLKKIIRKKYGNNKRVSRNVRQSGERY